MQSKGYKTIKIICAFLIIIFSFLVGYVYANNKETRNEINDSLKIAIVNNDQGIEIDGQTIAYGDVFLRSYKKDSHYEFTNINGAKQGLQNGEFSGYIVIPENFSRDISSLLTDKQKSVIIYDIVDNNTNLTKPTLSLVNEVIDSLDNQITEGYLRDILSNVTKSANKGQEIQENLEENNILINQISSTQWLQPLDLQEAIKLSVSDENIKSSLSSLDGIKTEISNNLENNFSSENTDFSNIENNYLSIDNTLSNLDKSKYYNISTDFLSLVDEYELKNKDGSPLSICIDRNSAKLYVEIRGELVASNKLNSYNIVSSSSEEGSYIDVSTINNSLVSKDKEQNKTNISIYNHNFTIYGSNIEIVNVDGLTTIYNAYKIETANNSYYPIDNKIQIQFKNSTSGYQSSDFVEMVNYNKTSASLLREVMNQYSLNPNQSIGEVINYLSANPSDDVIDNLSKIDSNVNVVSYLNSVNPYMFDQFLSSYLENQKGIEYNTTINRMYNDYDIIGQTNVVEGNTIAVNSIVINNQDIFSLDELKTQINVLRMNFNLLVSSVVKNMDYSIIDTTSNEIDESISDYITEVRKQILDMDNISDNNKSKIESYLTTIKDNITNQTTEIKNGIIGNNNNSISAVSSLNDNLDFVIKTGSVDEQTLKFLSSSIKSKVEGVEDTEEQEPENKTSKYLLVSGLIVAIAGISYCIYREKKPNR